VCFNRIGLQCRIAETSGVLRAMKVPYEVARGAIRFSLGRYNTEEMSTMRSKFCENP